MSIGENIKRLREKNYLTQADLAEKLGVSPSAVSSWEIDAKIPRMGPIEKMASLFGVKKSEIIEEAAQPSTDDLFRYKNIVPLVPRRIPLLGSVAAGEPIYAESDIEMYLPNSENIRCDFALTVKGDSMSPTYKNGDVVYVRKRPAVDDGGTAVVLVDDEATLKHVYRRNGGIALVSDNPDFMPMYYDEYECEQIRIVGIPVAFFRKV